MELKMSQRASHARDAGTRVTGHRAKYVHVCHGASRRGASRHGASRPDRAMDWSLAKRAIQLITLRCILCTLVIPIIGHEPS